MVDTHTVLPRRRPKRPSHGNQETAHAKDHGNPTTSEIPDLFFDEVLTHFNLSRIEIVVLMYLYRHVWCRPNLYKEYGISQLFNHGEMAHRLGLSLKDIQKALKQLEAYNFITTIRSGQYFVRKYFSKENDEKFGRFYDDFNL